MPCSYCKSGNHNRQRCTTFRQNWFRTTDVLMAKCREEGSEITRKVALKKSKQMLIKRKHKQNLEFNRDLRNRLQNNQELTPEMQRHIRREEQRQQERIEHEEWLRQLRIQREEHARQQRIQQQNAERIVREGIQAHNQLEDLITTLIDEYTQNISEEEFLEIMTIFRNAFPNGARGSSMGNIIYSNINQGRLSRILHNNLTRSRQEVEVVEKVEKQIEATECAICMNEFGETDIMVTPCGHKFHSSCMIKHFRNKNNCPCCRGILF